MGELGYHLKPIPICGDNQGLIFIASNPVTKKRSKHIDIRYHYIREVVERKFAEIFFINGDKNPADLLVELERSPTERVKRIPVTNDNR